MIRELLIKLRARYFEIPFRGMAIYAKALQRHNLNEKQQLELYKKVFAKKQDKTEIKLEKLGKVYENGFKAIHDFNLEIKPHEFVSLLGPSGCGKTTILRMIAGLETISEGKFKINNVVMNSSLPKERSLAMVFQNYALYPYMSVYENIAFGLKIATIENKISNEILEKAMSILNPNYLDVKYNKVRIFNFRKCNDEQIREIKAKTRKERKIKTDKVNIPELKIQLKKLRDEQDKYKNLNLNEIKRLRDENKDLNKGKFKFTKTQISQFRNEIKKYFESVVVWHKTIPARIEAFASIVGIKDYLKRKPAQLSGGQRQRVALVRAISKDASIFLFDEPLSNLDAKLRATMRTEIRSLHNKMNATSIFVTHDQVEAMTMSDKIVLMNRGYIQQIGTPQELFNNPSNVFVADFIGSPRINFVHAKLTKENQFELKTGKKVLISKRGDEVTKGMKQYIGKEVIVGIRPQNIITDPVLISESKENVFDVKVDSIENIGHENIIITSSKELGENFRVVTGRYVFVKPGDTFKIMLNQNTMQIFEKENGISISTIQNEETQKALNVWINSADERVKNQILSVNERTKDKLSRKVVKAVYYKIDKKRGNKVTSSKKDMLRKAAVDKSLVEIVEEQSGN